MKFDNCQEVLKHIRFFMLGRSWKCLFFTSFVVRFNPNLLRRTEKH